MDELQKRGGKLVYDPTLLVARRPRSTLKAFARMLLEMAGFTVAEAASGTEATVAALAIRPRLVLLDIQLPDFDGFEVARRLAAQEHRPVIVLTSTREASDYGGQIAASPAAGFLPKDQLSGAALRGFLDAGPP